MVKIEAIIQPAKLNAARDALESIGIDGITVTEARGHGRQKGHKEVYRGREYQIDLLPKIKLETVVPASRKDEVVRVLGDAVRTGLIGDGKIFISEIIEAIRIRDDSRGEAAL
jgi:nitrogen regulatory protein P-II 1